MKRLFMFCLFVGCTVSLNNHGKEVVNQPIPKWVETFSDPILNSLVSKANLYNKDLKIAEELIFEARANRLGSFSALFPQANPSADIARSSRDVRESYQAGFDASYEIDFFGKNRTRVKADDSFILATIATKEWLRTTLFAEVAVNYIELRNIQNQIKILKRNIQTLKASYDLTVSKQKAGLVNDLDVFQAQTQYLTMKSNLPSLVAAKDIVINRLNILTGARPGTIDAMLEKPGTLPTGSIDTIAQIPARMIENRPDVVSAKQQFLAAVNLKKSADAEVFPRVTLTSFLGFLFAPHKEVWSFGARISVPFIDFYRVRSIIDAADSKQKQALLNYEKTVNAAIEDVKNAFSRYINENNKMMHLKNARTASETTLKLANELYSKGLSSLLNVLIAEKELYLTEKEYAESQANTAKNIVSLYKTLNGS